MKKQSMRGVVLFAGTLLLAGCGDYLDVTNPGAIEDDLLNDPDAVRSLVTGMSGDLSEGLADLTYATSIMADELAHGGSYTQEGLWYRGIINDDEVNGYWADMQRMRWVAEQGIERMKSIEGYDYENDEYSIRANLYAGFANRIAGELSCNAVIDGGPVEPNTVHFERAEGYFSEALRLARALGKDDYAYAALAGYATVVAWQGDWAGARDSAALVPPDFRFDAVFSTNSGREENYVVSETSHTIGRRELTVYNTVWATRDSLDPRAPWSIPTQGGKVLAGQDGTTPFYRQLKYTALSDDIALAKGTEMLVLQAEAELRLTGDLAVATDLINQQRAVYELPDLPVPTTESDAWEMLKIERGAVVWLEARRFWDLRRWYEEDRDAFLTDRDACIPVSRNEQLSNPNIP